ncbi:MoaC-domain-containing protein, partial [Lindgomyces ingoldianus]
SPLDLTSTSTPQLQSSPPAPSLPHLTPTGSAHMVSISTKTPTVRTAIAVGTVSFSNPTPLSLIRTNSLKKGDVLSVARIAGIMAAKMCPEIIPLCHPITLSHVGVELFLRDPDVNADIGGEMKANLAHWGEVGIEAKVECTGATGVEMEALTAVMGAGLTVVDMCKAVDKGMRIEGVRVVVKEGGRSGAWRE